MTESTFYLFLFLGLSIVGAIVLVAIALFNDWIDHEIDDYEPKRTSKATTNYMRRPELDFDLKELDKQSPPTLGTKIKDRPILGD